MGSYLELVEGTGAGETFASGPELTAALQRMHDDATRRREMGAAAYAYFRANFSEDVVIPRYLALVHRFLSRPAVQPSLPQHDAPVHV